MSGHGGPKLTRDSLSLLIDAKHEATTRTSTNLLSPYEWNVGTGSESFYNQNGDGNSRIIGTNPFGQQAVLWQTLNNDADSNADGGWNTSSFPIDNTKTYRYSVWVKRQVLGNGSFYLGCHGYGSTTGVTSNDSSSWSANTNPYFISTGWPRSTGVWYLVVGHIFPHDWTTLGDHPDSGWYEVGNSKKLAGIDDRDYRWHNTTTTANYRTYLYYSTNSSTHQLWYAPRVDLCDGTEPSIADLVSTVNNRVDSISSISIDNYGAVKDVDNGYYNFDGNSDVMVLGQHDMRHDFTLECFVKFDGLSSEGIFGHGTPATRQGLHIVAVDSNRIRFGMYSNDTDFLNLGLTTGTWYHMVFTYNHSTYKKQLFINGREKTGSPVQTQTSYTYANMGSLRIGMTYGSGTYSPLDGQMSSVKKYDKVLEKRDIRANYAALRRRFK